MKKKFWIGILLFLTICCLSACSNEETIKGEGETRKKTAPAWNVEDVPKHVNDEIAENITVDADVMILSGFESGRADILEVKEIHPDREKVLEFFCEGKKVANKEKQEFLYGDTCEYYTFENGDVLQILKNGDFSYMSDLAHDISSCFREDNKEIFHRNKTDFSYISLKDAEQYCYEVAKKVGILIPKNAKESYRLAHDTLRQEEKIEDSEIMELFEGSDIQPREEWTSEDDSYCFRFYPNTNGYEWICEGIMASIENICTNSYCEIIYNESGIIEIGSPTNLITEQILEKQVKLIEFESVMELLKKKYENVIVKDRKLIVEKIQLGNVMVIQEEKGIYQSLPVWNCVIRDQFSGDGCQYTGCVFDATTGKEL